MKGWFYKMKKFFTWLKSLFTKKTMIDDDVFTEYTGTHFEDEEDETINADRVLTYTPCECDCNDCDCECHEEVFDESDEFFEFVETVDWENLTIEVIEKLNAFTDLHVVSDEFINWYKISKFKGLPDEFIRKYKDKIMWKEYNKSYLKKVTKEMLRAEGYLG